MPDDRNDNNSQTPRDPKIPGMPGGKKPTRTGWLYFLLACALLGYAFFNMGSGFAKSSNTVKLATSEMVSAIKQDRVEDLTYTVQDGSVTGHYWKTKKDKGDTSELKSFSSTYVGSDSLAELMSEHPDTKYIVNTNDPDFWGDLAMSVLPTIALIAIMFYFMRQMMGANNRNMQFGKTNAKTNEATRPKVKFEDVAGVDEAVEELEEIRDFLSDPDRYRKLGAKIPRGVLLVGPPGTGKTLLARACAGEAGVPFYSISGSDFVEMYVGVGASRVRDLFDKAKKTMPCIIFIDEIDAVGRQRGAGLGGGHDEREQTLNQLLVEMDGFEANDGIIVMAATNRADILDKALLRPGRFDRQVYVGLPDVKGREEILKVHTKKKPLAPDVSLRVIAQRTAGFAGADLENLVNEAALLAARRNRKAITMEDIEEASMKVMAGPEKKSRVVTPEEKKLTAYHEAGHAVAGFYCKHHPRVHEITIIPRGQAGGYTMYLPEKDRSYVTKGEMFEDIVSSLGGRVAEQLILEDISTGASNDLQQATNIARQMITKYGFSERLGPVVYGTSQEETFLGRDLGQGKGYSETTAAEIDGEMRDIIDEAYETCRRTLTEHIDQLHALAQALMEREKLNEQEFNTIMAGGTLPPREGDEPKPEQPAQTVQTASAETAQQAETAESAETAEPAEQAETAEQMPASPAPETPDAQDPQN